LNNLDIASAAGVTFGNSVYSDNLTITNGGTVDFIGNVNTPSGFTCTAATFDNIGAGVTVAGGNIDITTSGAMTLGSLNAGAGDLTLNAGGTINSGSLRAGMIDITAATIGLTSRVTTYVDQNSIFFNLSDQDGEGTSGHLIAGGTYYDFVVPSDHITATTPGKIIYDSEFGSGSTVWLPIISNLEGTISSLNALSTEQEKLDQEARQSTGADFFITPPLDLYIEMEDEKMEEVDNSLSSLYLERFYSAR
jgi:hypothetical protein